MKRILILVAMLFTVTLAHAQVGLPLESLPMQDGGRIKPFGTFARETLQLVYNGLRAGNTESASKRPSSWSRHAHASVSMAPSFQTLIHHFHYQVASLDACSAHTSSRRDLRPRRHAR